MEGLSAMTPTADKHNALLLPVKSRLDTVFPKEAS